MREISPEDIKIPQCCLDAAEDPDNPCEHVLMTKNIKVKTNIGL